jgi:DNA-binding beta-propeller fold protein YncE
VNGTDNSQWREFFDLALGETPGRLTVRAVRRRVIRRRVTEAGAVAAAVALVAAGVTAAAGVLGPAAPWSAAPGPAVAAVAAAPPFIYASTRHDLGIRHDRATIATVTPIDAVTGHAGKPLSLELDGNLDATPDGKTVYVLGGSTVIPINTTTGQPGPPISVPVPGGIGWMLVDPNGKVAYLTGALGSDIIPLNLATNQTGKPIKGVQGADGVFSPDGKTVYILDRGIKADTVTPVDTATGTAGRPVAVDDGKGGSTITISPEGKTLYVAALSSVIPVSTATGQTGTPIPVHSDIYAMVLTPDGKTLYVSGSQGEQDKYTVTPVNTTTRTAGKHISIPSAGEQMVMTPDGQHVYLTSDEGPNPEIIPISTSTNTVSPTILRGTESFLAVSPNRKILYALTNRSVIPVSTVTGQPGRPTPIRNGHLQDMIVVP